MRISQKSGLALLSFIALLALPGIGRAYVMAEAAMKIFNLQFSSTDPNAELNWFEEDSFDPFSGWRGDILAQAQDTLSGTDADDDEVYGDNEHIEVTASTALVTSKAEYTVVNGPGVAKGTGEVDVVTNSALEIPDPLIAQASGEAGGVMDNIFWITGGVPDAPVDVTFTLDYLYTLDAEADENGFYEVFVFALLEIDDPDDLMNDPDNVDDFVDTFFLRRESGTATGVHVRDQPGRLTLDATLVFEKDFFLFGAADSEVFGTNVPEPSTWLLGLWGPGLLVLIRRRRKDRV